MDILLTFLRDSMFLELFLEAIVHLVRWILAVKRTLTFPKCKEGKVPPTLVLPPTCYSTK